MEKKNIELGLKAISEIRKQINE